MEREKGNQRLLQQLGYYQGPISGRFDGATKQALQSFQAAQGLRPSGAYTARTKRALRKELAERKSLQQINNSNRGTYMALIVERQPQRNGPTLYRAFAGTGRPIYVGSDSRNLVAAVNARVRNRNVDTVYLVPRNFAPNRKEAFAANTRRHQGNINSRTLVRVVEAPNGSPRSLLHFRTSESGWRMGRASEPKQVTEGHFTGYHTSNVKVQGDGQNVKLTVFGKTKQAVKTFMQRLGTVLSNSPKQANLSWLANKARKDVQKQLGLSRRDLILQFQDESGYMNWARSLRRHGAVQ